MTVKKIKAAEGFPLHITTYDPAVGQEFDGRTLKKVSGIVTLEFQDGEKLDLHISGGVFTFWNMKNMPKISHWTI